MTTIFDGYDEEYKTIASSISTTISQIVSYENADAAKKISDINHTGDLITQANQLVQQMLVEVRSLDGPTRKKLTKKVSQYQSNLKSLSEDYKNMKEKEERNGLYGDRNGIEMKSMEQRNRVTRASDKLKGTSDKIDSAARTIADTEEVAIGITEELSRNRETIEATRQKVKGVNEMAKSGGRIIGRMTSRDRRQRICIYSVLAFILVALAVVLYFGVFGKPNTNSKTQ